MYTFKSVSTCKIWNAKMRSDNVNERPALHVIVLSRVSEIFLHSVDTQFFVSNSSYTSLLSSLSLSLFSLFLSHCPTSSRWGECDNRHWDEHDNKLGCCLKTAHVKCNKEDGEKFESSRGNSDLELHVKTRITREKE